MTAPQSTDTHKNILNRLELETTYFSIFSIDSNMYLAQRNSVIILISVFFKAAASNAENVNRVLPQTIRIFISKESPGVHSFKFEK